MSLYALRKKIQEEVEVETFVNDYARGRDVGVRICLRLINEEIREIESRVSQLKKENEEQINRVGMTKIMENENFERRILHVRTDRINELRGVLGK